MCRWGGMPGIFVIVFWVWTAVSVLILLRRLFTTGTLRPSGKREKLEPLVETESTDRVAEFEAKLAAAAPPAADTADAGATADTADAEVQPDAAAPADRPTALTPDPGAEDIPRAESLAEALTGIEMPADLSPLVGDSVDPRRMLFSTDAAPPAAVGGAVADELERLGFTIEPLDERSIAAMRPGAALEVRILPSAESARATIGAQIETIADDVVITEFQLR